jgi:hypothetical protein
MKTITMIRYALGLATIVGATVAVGATAEARSVGGIAGSVGPDALSTCFSPQSNGAILGVAASGCNTSPQFCVPLVVDDGGPHPVQVEVLSPSQSDNIGCFARATDQTGVITTQTAKMGAPTFGGPSLISLGGVSTPAGGMLFACCDMPPGTELFTINW